MFFSTFGECSLATIIISTVRIYKLVIPMQRKSHVKKIASYPSLYDMIEQLLRIHCSQDIT